MNTKADPQERSWELVTLEFKVTSGIPAAKLPTKLDNLRIFSGVEKSQEITINSVGSLAFHFIFKCILAAASSVDVPGRNAIVIVPRAKGYLVRTDIIPLRLVDCEYVEHVTSLIEGEKLYSGDGLSEDSLITLPSLLSAGVGGMIIACQTPGQEYRTVLNSIEGELTKRLSFSWIIEHLQPRQTLAIVEGGRRVPADNSETGSVYATAKALGIDVIVLDNAGHWIEGPEFTHLRKEFVPIKLPDPPDAELFSRIVAAVQGYQGRVDGIISFCDSYMPAVATAAQELGLPTSTPEAFEIATNKYRTSVFVGHDAYRASSAEEAVEIAARHGLSYPLIVKPCMGWSSEGVSRVDDMSGLEQAVKSIDTKRHGVEFVMEKYCDGPEVDANFVLFDGEIVFYEVCDDFPKGADTNGSSTLGTFIELDSVFPSILPSKEIETLRDSFHHTLKRLGLTNGVYHLEGRVENSTAEYIFKDGVLDLHPRETTTPIEPTAWLIEINPRPQGMKGAQVTASTYGVDYWGLSLVIALRDKERVKALAQPFSIGAQYTCIEVFIPCDYELGSCEGFFDSDDICAELLHRRPDFQQYISQCGTLVTKGQKVEHPSSGQNKILAYYNVFSRKSRAHALLIAKQIREETRFSIR